MKSKPTFTGILIKREHGLDVYHVIIRNVFAHHYLSIEAAQHKLAWYNVQLQGLAA